MARQENLDVLEDEDEVEDEELDEEEDSEESDAEVTSEADEDEEEEESSAKEPTRDQKRIRDLQSRLDKATAELNKRQKSVKGDNAKAEEVSPEVRQWMEVAKEATRSQIFESDPVLKNYKIDKSVITGDTPDEMKASAKALSRLVARIQTQVRNQVLQEHGFSEPPREGGAEKRQDYATMDQKTFDALVEKHSGM